MNSIRWWPAGLIVAGEIAVLIFIWFISEVPVRQARVLQTLGSLLVSGALFGVWWLFLSRIPWKRRILGAALVGIAALGFLALFEFEGMSGDLVPRFVYRFGGAVAAVRGGDSPAGLRVIDYPQFQGPDRTAIVAGPAISLNWTSDPPELLWRRSVGEGLGGFSIAGGLAVTQEQDEQGETVTAYLLTSGEKVWEHRNPGRYRSPIAGAGPRSNPTIAGNQVFSMGSTGWLTALDLQSGALIWEHNILEDRQRPVPTWGKSCSPLVLGDQVIVSIYRTAVVAYSTQDGSLLWETGPDGANYASPTLVRLAGVEQIVSFNSRGPAAYSPVDGSLLWSFDWPSGSEHIALPVPISDNRLLVSSGYGVGSKLLQVDRTERGFEVREIWHSLRLKSKFANYFVIGEYIYGLDDGIFTCLKLATGERVWKDGRYGHGQMIRQGSTILLLAEDGRMVAIDASPEGLREIASFQALEGHTWNPPALAGRLLVVRNSRQAASYLLEAPGD